MFITGAMPFLVKFVPGAEQTSRGSILKTSSIVPKDHAFKLLDRHGALKANQLRLCLLYFAIKNKRSAERREETEHLRRVRRKTYQQPRTLD